MNRAPLAFGLTARLAWREVRLRPWRTLLVALLVALPVAGTTFASVMTRTVRQSDEAAWQLNSGNADAMSRGNVDRALVPAMPPGTTAVTERSADFQLLRTTSGARSRAFISDLAVGQSIVDGIISLDDGRLPSADGEVLLSHSAARDLDAHVGDTIDLDRPVARTVVVTGIGHLAAALDQRLALVAPGSDLLGAPARFVQTKTYLQLPAAMTQPERETWARAARDSNFVLSPITFPSLQPTSTTNVDASVRWIWVIGGLVLTVAGIVISSAFASGARRQLATLGQLAANGAGPRMLRRTLFLQGTWTGVIGSVAGLGLGFGLLAVIDPYRDRIFNRETGGYVLRPIDLIPILLMGTLATTVAALVPARTTSRVPVLAALAGRRPLGRVPRGLTLAGAISISAGLALLGLAVLGSTGDAGGGTVWTVTAVVGGIGMLLGASALAPAFVSLMEPIAARLHGPWRFAARSLVRQRTRTGGVVSAVCATSALAVMASALVLGTIAGDDAQHANERTNEVQLISQQFTAVPAEKLSPPLPGRAPAPRPGIAVAPPEDLIAALTAVVPSFRAIHTSVVNTDDDSSGVQEKFGPLTRSPAVADASTLEAYKLSDKAAKALSQFGAVYLDDSANDIVPQTLRVGARTIDLVTVHVDALGILPRVLITPALAAELQLTPSPGPVVLRAAQPLTRQDRDLLSEIRDDYDTFGKPTTDGPFVNTGIAIISGSDAPPAFVLEALLSGIALLFALFVVAASLALAAAETRDERDVLAVVGAAPATMRRTSAHKAVLLAVFGAALAIPVGFLPVIVFTAADRSSTPFLVFPWRTVAMLLLVVPVLIGLFTSGASTLALRLRPVRVSTMTFD
jgi:putative ABC transport system permease protein